MAKPKTIVLKGTPLRKEGVASEAITPGHLVEFGGVNDLRKHATAGGNARKAFAVEYDPENEIDTACAAGDQVMYVTGHPGDEVYALVPAGAVAIAKGDPLESNGDGTLRKHVAPSQAVNEGGTATYTITQKVDGIVAYALEAVDNSAGASAVRISVEVA
jgi:glycerol kinase